MSHRAKVIATYRMTEHEVAQSVVSIESSYPDALAEARMTACAVVKAMVDDAYAHERVTTNPEPDTHADQ